HQSRGDSRRRQRAQGQPALRHHQPEAEPAVDLRKSLLPARRDREPDKRTARVADRPHQLQRFLGQPVPRAADCCRLPVDAGVASASRRHRLCAGSGPDTARTVVETWCSRTAIGTARGGAPARILSLSSHFPESGAGTRSVARITLASPSRNVPYTLPQLPARKNPVRKPLPCQLLHTHKFANTVIQPKSSRHHHVRRNLVAPQTTLSAIMNKAGYVHTSECDVHYVGTLVRARPVPNDAVSVTFCRGCAASWNANDN